MDTGLFVSLAGTEVTVMLEQWLTYSSGQLTLLLSKTWTLAAYYVIMFET